MTAQKELLRWTDTYTIDIAQPEDVLLCLMIVLAIDAANARVGINGGNEMIRAVVFDMDGLMFDTERLCALAWDEAGRKLGIGRRVT